MSMLACVGLICWMKVGKTSFLWHRLPRFTLGSGCQLCSLVLLVFFRTSELCDSIWGENTTSLFLTDFVNKFNDIWVCLNWWITVMSWLSLLNVYINHSSNHIKSNQLALQVQPAISIFGISDHLHPHILHIFESYQLSTSVQRVVSSIVTVTFQQWRWNTSHRFTSRGVNGSEIYHWVSQSMWLQV